MFGNLKPTAFSVEPITIPISYIKDPFEETLNHTKEEDPRGFWIRAHIIRNIILLALFGAAL